MANYLVGDIHGCFTELQAVLKQAQFNPDSDILWLVGDLVARGPDSLSVLRYVRLLGNRARIVLGNHDLHLLAIHAGIRRNKPKDHLTEILNAPDCDELINWLRHQPLLQVDDDLKLVMAHAGVSPQWDIDTAKSCAREIEAVLSSDSYPLFLNSMYGDLPNYWSESLTGLNKLRYSTNVLTRMRFCYPNGQLDMVCKESPKSAPAPLQPWFNLPSLIAKDYSIAFGHWAALNGTKIPNGFYALDSGCCWGGKLTLLRWEDKHYFAQASTLKPN